MKTIATQPVRRVALASVTALLATLGLTGAASAEPTIHQDGTHVACAAISTFARPLRKQRRLALLAPRRRPVLPHRHRWRVSVWNPSLEWPRYSTRLPDQRRLETSESITTIRLGSGLFYRAALGDTSTAYIGPRLALVLNSASDEDLQPDASGNETKVTATVSRTDFSLGLAGGGEHFFSQYFSLGAEAQLGMTFLGNPPSSTTGARRPGLGQRIERLRAGDEDAPLRATVLLLRRWSRCPLERRAVAWSRSARRGGPPPISIDKSRHFRAPFRRRLHGHTRSILAPRLHPDAARSDRRQRVLRGE
jgi:hypothetical protein